jgi:hypothetical protein
VDNEERLLYCAGRSLRQNELNWDIATRETFAIVLCVMSQRHLLIDKEVIIRTDNKTAVYMQGLKHSTSPRLVRWALAISSIVPHAKYEYIKSADNVIPDAISRRADLGEPDAMTNIERELLEGDIGINVITETVPCVMCLLPTDAQTVQYLKQCDDVTVDTQTHDTLSNANQGDVYMHELPQHCRCQDVDEVTHVTFDSVCVVSDVNANCHVTVQPVSNVQDILLCCDELAILQNCNLHARELICTIASDNICDTGHVTACDTKCDKLQSDTLYARQSSKPDAFTTADSRGRGTHGSTSQGEVTRHQTGGQYVSINSSCSAGTQQERCDKQDDTAVRNVSGDEGRDGNTNHTWVGLISMMQIQCQTI